MTAGGDQPESKAEPESRLSAWTKNAGKVIAVLVAAVGLAAGLKDLGVWGSDQSALAHAAEQTTDAGTSKLSMSITAESGAKTTEQKANGAFDYVGEIGHLTYTDGSKQLLLKPYLYLQFRTEDVWCKYNLSALGPGFLFGALTGFESDPAAALVNLEEHGEYEEIGDENLFGVQTTHYAGQIDLLQLANTLPERQRRLLRSFGSFNDNELPVQVWLDEDDLPRRISTSFTAPQPDGTVIETEASFDFSDFGVPVAVKPPPESKTVGEREPPCRLT